LQKAIELKSYTNPSTTLRALLLFLFRFFRSRIFNCFFDSGFLYQSFFKFLNSSQCVHNFFLLCVKWMAFGADFGFYKLFCCSNVKSISARAVDRSFRVIFWMYVCFHCILLIICIFRIISYFFYNSNNRNAYNKKGRVEGLALAFASHGKCTNGSPAITSLYPSYNLASASCKRPTRELP